MTQRPSFTSALLLSALFLLSACSSENVAQGLTDQKEANEIMEVLWSNNLSPKKVAVTNTQGASTYSVAVPNGQSQKAIRVLNHFDLPRNTNRGYTEVFSGSSNLIPTAVEEKAKQMEALQGEIQAQLLLIDGVLDAHVVLNIPEESPLKIADDKSNQGSASVAIKYLPNADGTKPITEQQVQSLVSSGVEKLSQDQVFALLTPSKSAATLTLNVQASEAASVALPANSWLGRLNTKTLNMAISVVVVVVILLAVGLIFLQLRLRSEHNRLLRLQAEVNKTRGVFSDDNS